MNAISPYQNKYQSDKNDSLPYVLFKDHTDLVNSKLKYKAAILYSLQHLPETMEEWIPLKSELRNKIFQKTGLTVNHKLPVNLQETGKIQLNGYSVRNIFFQTRPGIYATANLYIPESNEKLPGVIVMMGHSNLGKLYDKYQSVGHSLALNGYVALCIDPWGAGERSIIHGEFEDHGDGNNIGSSLMNIGETLMGMEISDNIRGIDLLCSLPFVDSAKIGATGASGGGNQTMWLAAIDERVKAVVPVVSVGTFESYIMETPCICEVLPDGLTFTEEAEIISLIAPRAIKICNHEQDNNPPFIPNEMIRNFQNARKIFDMYKSADNINYQIFNLPHEYLKEDREVMLSWFDLHLKGIGDGSPKKEIPFELIPIEDLMVFKKGERDKNVLSTEEFCKQNGYELREKLLGRKSINADDKREELRKILRFNNSSRLRTVHEFSAKNGWIRLALETTDNKLIPLLLKMPKDKSYGFTIVCNTQGKSSIPEKQIQSLTKTGKGIVVFDLFGTGEVASTSSKYDRNGNLRTYSRSLLWLGETLIGEWVKELDLVVDLLHTKFNTRKINFDGDKEAALAGLFLCAMKSSFDTITLRNAPVSYLFDTSKSIDYFGMGIHIPGILKWGDISLAAALCGKTIFFIHPVTMSGQTLNERQLEAYTEEFEFIKSTCKQNGKIELIDYTN